MKALIPAIALAVAGGPALSQQQPDDSRRLEELERKVEILSRELEAQKTNTSTPETTDSSQGMGIAASKVYQVKGGFSIGGYGEFLYQSKENRQQDGTTGVGEKTIDTLRLVLYTGYKFNDRILFNSEIEFEHGGYSDEHPEGEAIVEFAYLDFLLNKAINLRAGQMLVPMGFINELHEPPAFLGSLRPGVERYLIPTTWHENGVGIHGELPGNLNYRLYVMNGLRGDKFTAEGIRDGRQDGKEAQAQSLAWTGRLDWHPFPGVILGASFYSGNSNQFEGESLPTTLVDLHGEWRIRGLQLRGLYVRTTLGDGYLKTLGTSDPAREAGTRQWGGYLEAGYDLLESSQRSLIPFLRWERLNTQAEVIPAVVSSGANDQAWLTLGVNYKPIPNIAVKLDYQKVENRARSGQNQFNASLGFFF
jgi:hypothetical protein